MQDVKSEVLGDGGPIAEVAAAAADAAAATITGGAEPAAASSARIAWFATLGARTERDRPSRPISLPPPDHVRALRGRGQVTIEWPPVAGAAGYLVHRGPAADGPFAPIDQGGGRAPMDEV